MFLSLKTSDLTKFDLCHNKLNEIPVEMHKLEKLIVCCHNFWALLFVANIFPFLSVYRLWT